MENIRLFCENTGEYLQIEKGKPVGDLLQSYRPGLQFPPLAVIVDNQLKELSYCVNMPYRIRFIDITDVNGNRTYQRSITLMLQKAVNDLFPEYRLILDYNLPNGPYIELFSQDGQKAVLSEIDCLNLENKMKDYVSRKLPIRKSKIVADDAIALVRSRGQVEKAKLVELSGRFFVSIYALDGYVDTFYGPLVDNTSVLTMFSLVRYKEGLFLKLPDQKMQMAQDKPQDKLFSVFQEDARWVSVIGAKSISSVSQEILKGEANKMIMVAEALHERRYADIADMIFARKSKVKLVLIAGPSSSGKTTTSLRIALQCRVLGLNPKVIELDNYFVDREHTPRDENGQYDFEDVHAMDLPFLNQQLQDLIAGKEVELPTFDFLEGKRFFKGTKMSLKENDILIMEGIHALNPILTSGVPAEAKFKIYASALTSVSIDENNNISTSDNRLLRRMVRDNNYRGIGAEETILRWPSVRRGEIKNIFPYQEEADAMFNSSLMFELPLLKYFAEPLLRRIAPNSPAYTEAIRLLKFLSYFPMLNPSEMETVPPTSILREFIGGSKWK